MSKSAWAAYKAEHDGTEVIEVEGGFMAYKTAPAWDHVLITDVYVQPDLRKSGLAARLLHSVEEKARALGKPCVVGYVDVASNTSNMSLLAQIHCGFVPFEANAGRIWLRKVLKEV